MNTEEEQEFIQIVKAAFGHLMLLVCGICYEMDIKPKTYFDRYLTLQDILKIEDNLTRDGYLFLFCLSGAGTKEQRDKHFPESMAKVSQELILTPAKNGLSKALKK
jgi:hypothetical protein